MSARLAVRRSPYFIIRAIEDRGRRSDCCRDYSPGVIKTNTHPPPHTSVPALEALCRQPGVERVIGEADMAVSELAAATIELCEKPQDQAVIDAFVSARRRYRQVQESLGG